MITLLPKPQSTTHKKFLIFRISNFVFLACLVFIFSNFVFASLSRAASLSVSLSVGLTYFQVQGYTSPLALVKLIENGTVIATTSSDSAGSFALSTLGEDGLHNYTLYATDQGGANTESLSLSVSLTPGSTTSMAGLILPPTYTHNGLDQPVGDDLIFTGYAVPGSQIILVLDSSESQRTQVGSDGRYLLRLTTDLLSTGSHNLFLKNQLDGGAISDPTITLSLWMRARPASTSTPSVSIPSPDPSLVPLLTSLLPGLSPYDLNKDGKISLEELRQSLIIWLKNLAGQGDDCDLNDDGICNLQDFSILLYYINR